MLSTQAYSGCGRTFPAIRFSRCKRAVYQQVDARRSSLAVTTVNTSPTKTHSRSHVYPANVIAHAFIVRRMPPGELYMRLNM